MYILCSRCRISCLFLLCFDQHDIVFIYFLVLFSAIDDFPQDTLNYLTQRGHEIKRILLVGVIQGIAVDKEGNVEAYADPRKDGKEGHAVVVQRT